MSFFGLFGAEDANCECNKNLKAHLKKCAGLGDLPPLDPPCCPGSKPSGCDEDENSATTDLAGPPKCSGKTKAPKCSPAGANKLVVFVPKCDVPPTATFKCPDNCCTPPCPKPKCEPACPKDDGCQKPPSNCPQVCTVDGKFQPPGGKSGCGGCPKPPPPKAGGCGCGGGGKGQDEFVSKKTNEELKWPNGLPGTPDDIFRNS